MSTVMPSAVQRLEHSRERLRVAMRAISAPPESAHAAAAPLAWLEAVKSIPGVDIVLATLQRWWAQHPLRAASDATGQAVQAIVAPIARRHPVLLVLSAVWWARCWRAAGLGDGFSSRPCLPRCCRDCSRRRPCGRRRSRGCPCWLHWPRRPPRRATSPLHAQRKAPRRRNQTLLKRLGTDRRTHSRFAGAWRGTSPCRHSGAGFRRCCHRPDRSRCLCWGAPTT